WRSPGRRRSRPRNPRRPTSIAPGGPRRPRRSAVWVSFRPSCHLCLVSIGRAVRPGIAGQLEADQKTRAQPLARFHAELPTHRADQLARLERADAETARLGRMERLEQSRADEFGAHPAARIDDFHDRLRVFDPRVDEYRAALAA